MLFPTTSNILNYLNPSITIVIANFKHLQNKNVICESIFNVGMVGLRECASSLFLRVLFLLKN